MKYLESNVDGWQLVKNRFPDSYAIIREVRKRGRFSHNHVRHSGKRDYIMKIWRDRYRAAPGVPSKLPA